MSLEPASATRPPLLYKAHAFPTRPDPSGVGRLAFEWSAPYRLTALILLAIGFVWYDAGCLDPGPIESRLGLAAAESFAPLGRVFGGWEPAVWPLPLALSRAWSWFEVGAPTSASVRWPSAIAAAVVGLMLCRRTSGFLGGRAGVLVAVCWFGSLGMMDRSAGAGIDLIMGLATIAALDRVLGRGSDLVAGLWTALAFLAGGWPPVAIVALSTVVIGRREASLSWRLLLPPVIALVGWSAWVLKVAPAEAWGAALTLPLTQGPSFLLGLGVLALGMPWSLLAVLAAGRATREGWGVPSRLYVVGWLQVAGASVIAGSVVPGLALAAKTLALAGLAVASGAVIDRLLSGTASPFARKWVIAVGTALAVGWMVLAFVAGGYLAAAVSYYRVLAVLLMIASVPVAALGMTSVAKRNVRGSILTLALLAVFLKIGHSGYYVHEWNYRRSQGPWGRALAQWVPPNWPIYTIHAWNTDLCFATGRPVRQLVTAHHLEYQPGEAKFVLLLRSEFENWPATAQPLQKVADFQDEHGDTRVIARTAGPLPWDRIKSAKADE